MKPEDPNVQAWLEPELEARLVASLLGEASAFEQAELDRLLAERPEIAGFQRRLQAVHGLIGDAVNQGPDDEWKLPKDKRAKLLETIRGTASHTDKPGNVVAEKRPKRQWISIAAAAAVVLFAGAVATTSMLSGIRSGAAPDLAMTRERKALGMETDSKSDTLGAIDGLESAASSFGELAQAEKYAYQTPNTPSKPRELSSRNSSVTLSVDPANGPGYTIDMDVVPEVVEFDGFANYKPSSAPQASSDDLAMLGDSVGQTQDGATAFFDMEEESLAQVGQSLGRLDHEHKELAYHKARAELRDQIVGKWEMPAPEPSAPVDRYDARSSRDTASYFAADNGLTKEAEITELASEALSESITEDAPSKKRNLGDLTKLAETNKKGLSVAGNSRFGITLDEPAVAQASEAIAPSNPEELELMTMRAKAPELNVHGRPRLDHWDFKKNESLKSTATKAKINLPGIEFTKDTSVRRELSGSLANATPGQAGGNAADFWGVSKDFAQIPNGPATADLSRQLGEALERAESAELGRGFQTDDSLGEPSNALSDADQDFSQIAGISIEEPFGSELGDDQFIGATVSRRTDQPFTAVKGAPPVNLFDDTAPRLWMDTPAGAKSAADDPFASTLPTEEIAKHEARLSQLDTLERHQNLDFGAVQNRANVAGGGVADGEITNSALTVPTPTPQAEVQMDGLTAGLRSGNEAIVASNLDAILPSLETPQEAALAQQSNKVEEARLRMLDLAERYRIIDLATMQNRASHTGDPLTGTGTILMSSMRDTYSAESNIAQIKMQIEKLSGLEGEELIQGAAMLDINDASLQELLPRYQRSILEKQKLIDSGLSKDHREVKAAEEAVTKTSSMLEGAIKGVRSTLKTKLDMANKALALAKDIEEGKKDTSMDERRKYAEYSEATKEYELQKNMLANMQAKHVKNEPPRLLKRAKAKKPAPKPLPQLNEKHAKQEPFSTFSLHVSDVAFKLAKATLLEQNKWPEVEKVRVEEFVNAFDYGDPAPTQAEKVACQIEQAAHPFRQQRNLLRISMRTAEMGRSSGTPLQITLLLDTSGSMERADRQESISRAMEVLTSQLTPNDTVTLIGFARQPRLIQDRLTGEALRNLPKFVRQTPSEGGTNLEEALLLGAEHARRQFNEAGQNRIVLLTDGAANLGDANAESLRNLVVGLRQEGIAFDACGVGAKGLNDTVLEALTRDGDGRYYLLNKPEDADAGFARQLAGAFRPAARNVKVQLHFNDRRVGKYRLLGFEKHRLKKEDFRNDKVDAAEMASAEAGVAVYEIEPLSQGKGEIGEVSVRFQDMTTGHMVERSWTIAYHAGVPVLEEASPSLQLASTAAFLGEKLKKSPFGQAIDLEELSQIQTNLRQCYSSDQRVASLIAMIEKAKQY